MGTTFIKLGQFLATRPDIIGEETARNLEKLQDKLPAFDTYHAKKIIKKEIGETQYNNILELSEPIAAASIVAKCIRDKIMFDLSKIINNYGWVKYVGYGSKEHLLALKKYGIT